MRLLIALFALCVVVSCGGRESYIDMQPVDAYNWHKPVSIIYDNSDTVSMRSIAIALRYNESFKSDTLTVKVQTSLPAAFQYSESILLRLRREYKATAMTASECVGYRENCLLSERGCYIFTITPCRNVSGIEAVGIEIAE